MNVVALIVPLSILLGSIFVVCFIFAARKGQYDDLDTPAYRLLLDDEETHKQTLTTNQRIKK